MSWVDDIKGFFVSGGSPAIAAWKFANKVVLGAGMEASYDELTRTLYMDGVGAFRTLFETDFSTCSAQTFTADGQFTLSDGSVWYKMYHGESASQAANPAIIPGWGLRFYPSNGGLPVAIYSKNSDLGLVRAGCSPVRLSVMRALTYANPGSTAQHWYGGYNYNKPGSGTWYKQNIHIHCLSATGGTADILNWLPLTQHNNGTAGCPVAGLGNVTIGTTNCWRITLLHGCSPGESLVECGTSVSGEWPAENEWTIVCRAASGLFLDLSYPDYATRSLFNNWGLFLCGVRGDVGDTSHYMGWRRVRMEGG